MKVGLLLAESRGGIGQHVASLVPRYAAAGHQVTVCSPAETAEHFDFTPAGLVREPTLLRGCDVVHAHGYKAGLAARRARLRPLVVTWHNAVLATGVRGAVLRLGQRVVARSADLTLGASSDLVGLAQRYGARQARLAPVAAPRLPERVRDRAEVRAALGLTDEPLVLSVGRLAPQKDYPLLLSVADGVRGRLSDAVFAVVGDGPLRPELEERIAAEGLPVRLLGHRGDVGDLLAAADVFLLTSHWEARALVVQEAMQAGVPVVARPVGGIPELVGDAALLGRDAAELTDQVCLVLTDAGTAVTMRDGGRRRAATWPDEDAVAAQLLDTYAGLIASRA
ncbi:MAG: glycosyltransferase family 4 protein [Kribbellaceae bacterium]